MECYVKVGRVFYPGYRRSLLLTLEVRLKKNEREGCYMLSIAGNVWLPSGHDIIEGGQISDTIREFLRGNKFKELYVDKRDLEKLLDIWDEWHLNDMKPGTRRQMEALKEVGLFGGDYDKQVRYLEKIGLLEDDGVRYGEKWICWDLPEDVKDFVIGFCRKYGEMM